MLLLVEKLAAFRLAYFREITPRLHLEPLDFAKVLEELLGGREIELLLFGLVAVLFCFRGFRLGRSGVAFESFSEDVKGVFPVLLGECFGLVAF